MEEPLYDEMFAMEERHWWFRAKRNIVMSLIERFAAPGKDCAILEIGCGCGSTLVELTGRYGMVRGIDSSDRAVEFCRQRGVTVEKGALPGEAGADGGRYDVVLLLDVLEHIDDDRGSLRAAAGYLKPGGIMIACVPAYQFLYTLRDAYHDHKRRYSRRAYEALFEGLPLRKILSSHYNCFLFLPAAAVRLSRKIFRYDKAGPDLSLPGPLLNSILFHIFSLEKCLLPFWTLPFGLSLISVHRREDW